MDAPASEDVSEMAAAYGLDSASAPDGVQEEHGLMVVEEPNCAEARHVGYMRHQ